MNQIQAKVCMLGSFAVGKTSLVARYVTNVFSDKYLTTVGVKVDTKEISVDETQMKLVVWDIAGEAEISAKTRMYLRGASDRKSTRLNSSHSSVSRMPSSA